IKQFNDVIKKMKQREAIDAMMNNPVHHKITKKMLPEKTNAITSNHESDDQTFVATMMAKRMRLPLNKKIVRNKSGSKTVKSNRCADRRIKDSVPISSPKTVSHGNKFLDKLESSLSETYKFL